MFSIANGTLFPTRNKIFAVFAAPLGSADQVVTVVLVDDNLLFQRRLYSSLKFDCCGLDLYRIANDKYINRGGQINISYLMLTIR
jgi:hypothetical protein